VIQCLDFPRLQKEYPARFCRIELMSAGIVFRDCPIHEENGKQWVAFPARPDEGADGVKRWQTLIEFAPGAKREVFHRLAIDPINTYTKQNAEPASW
jgi:hypothetical protein